MAKGKMAPTLQWFVQAYSEPDDETRQRAERELRLLLSVVRAAEEECYNGQERLVRALDRFRTRPSTVKGNSKLPANSARAGRKQ